MLVERDSDGFADWLKGHAERLGVESVATDDLSTYKPVIDKLGLEHQVCVMHVVRQNVTRRLRKAGKVGKVGSRGGEDCLTSCLMTEAVD